MNIVYLFVIINYVNTIESRQKANLYLVDIVNLFQCEIQFYKT